MRALDAAMPFDFEHQAQAQLARSKQLKVGIVGFGTFGQFLAKRLMQHGHLVTATSRSPYADVATKMGVQFFQDMDDFCEDHPDVVRLMILSCCSYVVPIVTIDHHAGGAGAKHPQHRASGDQPAHPAIAPQYALCRCALSQGLSQAAYARQSATRGT